MKKCNKCKELKSLEEFSKCKSFKDGKQNICKLCKSTIDKNYKTLNPQYNKISGKKWRDSNPNYQIDYFKSKPYYWANYSQLRLKQPQFKIKHNISNLIRNTFKSACRGEYKKSKRTEEILGCTLEEFINHLQSQFTKGMTLENHGEWEMDHIIPISSAKTEDGIIKLNHHSNYQPLWKEDNRKKSNKY
jgi:hypothetical protein